jgi:hypothetical protein
MAIKYLRCNIFFILLCSLALHSAAATPLHAIFLMHYNLKLYAAGVFVVVAT